MACEGAEFTRSRKGYDPKEVDAAIIEFKRQAADWKQRYAVLSETVAQYDGKVRQFVGNTRKLENERERERLRVTGILNQMALLAEQTKHAVQSEVETIMENTRREAERIVTDAKREAETIASQAREDLAATQKALDVLIENTQIIRQHSIQYALGTNTQLCEIETLISNTRNSIFAVSSSPQTDACAPQPVEAVQSPQSPAAAGMSAESQAGFGGLYAAYLELMKKGYKPSYQTENLPERFSRYPGDKPSGNA